MKVTHNTERKRFDAYTDDGLRMGSIEYSGGEDGILVAEHTEVMGEYRGMGVAHKLLDAMAQYAEENGLKIRAVCSYVQASFEERPHQYQNIIAK